MFNKYKLGMAMFILSESVFFGLLVIAYIDFRVFAGTGEAASRHLDPVVTGIYSIFLFSSSFTMWRATVAAEKDTRLRKALWLGATVVLGAVFLVGQGREYARLIGQNVTISRDLFGTTFFTLTGFHGLHVFIGLLCIAILLGLAAFGPRNDPAPAAVDTVSLYWHFVDGVWVVIFAVVYLWIYL